jgi:rSAM/selenodomain-associated transferase 1
VAGSLVSVRSVRPELLTPGESGDGEFLPYKTLQPGEPAGVGEGCCALAVMAKAPRPGKVKTRLSPPLTPEQASALNICFIRDTTENIDQVTEGSNSAGIVVFTPIGDEAAFDGLLPCGFQLLGQRGDGFGERLLYASEDLFACGFGAVCLIDSDSPTMPQAALSQAVAWLARAGDRVVLGGSDDGGYYLIGVKRMHPPLFERIDWSTERVLEQTLQRAREISLETALLPPWYDVDDAATLERLRRELSPAVGEAAPNSAASNGAASNYAGYDAKHTRAYLDSLQAPQMADAPRPAFTASRA